MEAIITRYAERETIRMHEAVGAVAPVPVAQEQVENVVAPTFATVTRRKGARSTDRAADRSRSRATQRNRRIKEGRLTENMPSFVLQEPEGKTEVRDMVWNQVVAKKVRPRCQTVTTRTGKVILKPIDKETTDALKHIARVSTLLQEDRLRWPRIIIRGIGANTAMVGSQKDLLAQNPELGIDENVDEEVLKPVFQTGPRGRSTTNWVVEVNPKFYSKFESTTLYLGFMRCRTNAYEEVTQCHKCLRHGHPAAKCNEKEQVYSHCGRKGHKALDCPAAEADPTCVNCRGKHSARDKTCSARTAYLLSQVKRTDYGIAP